MGALIKGTSMMSTIGKIYKKLSSQNYKKRLKTIIMESDKDLHCVLNRLTNKQRKLN